jgi:hypothetical protein
MNLLADKIELAKLLLETEDKSLIREIKVLFKKREIEFWDELPSFVKEEIKKSKEQTVNGLLTPHSNVMVKYSKYL